MRIETDVRSLIRYAEIIVVLVLSGFAFFTWRELQAVRRAPVALPHYEFEIGGEGASRWVQTRGTWVQQKGAPEPLQTASIECRHARMQCVESAAIVVFVGERGVMESRQTVFEVERWSASEIATKPVESRCNTRSLVLDLAEKRATSRVSASEEADRCKAQPARTLELVSGYRLRENPER